MKDSVGESEKLSQKENVMPQKLMRNTSHIPKDYDRIGISGRKSHQVHDHIESSGTSNQKERTYHKSILIESDQSRGKFSRIRKFF